MHNNLVWVTTPNIAPMERKLLTTCLDLLGARAMSRTALEEIVWDIVEALIAESDQQAGSKVFVRELAERAHAGSTADWTYVRPNYLIRFADKQRKITVGPVTALTASRAIEEIRAMGLLPDLNVVFRAGQDFKHDLKPGSALPGLIELPPVVWMVKTKTDRALVEEEARWRIDVAVSLLRLFHPQGPYPFFPHTGDFEADPFVKPLFDNEGITIGKDEVFGGGWAPPKHYVVDAAVAKVARSKKIRSVAAAVFQPAENTVAERISRSLGWLTKARQAHDPSERFLFIFTAIEALLTSEDKGAPIIQTVARHAGVILSNKAETRKQVFEQMIDLYRERSRLVHGGRRDVHTEDVNKAQHFAEMLCVSTLRQVRLNMKFEDMEAYLRSASFGGRWKMMSRKVSVARG